MNGTHTELRLNPKLALLAFLLPCGLLASTNQPSELPKAPLATNAQPYKLIEIRGRVVCLAEEMHQQYRAALPTTHEHIYGFKTEDGMYYTLLRTKFSEALFVDARFREKVLLLKGRVFPRSGIFEVATIRSLRDGRVYDLYYYCDVCDIQAVAPGPCECCQGSTELVEKPPGD